jgi:hypothetical protein
MSSPEVSYQIKTLRRIAIKGINSIFPITGRRTMAKLEAT